MTSFKMNALGVLTRDPELRFTQSGKAVANFTLAHSTSWKGQDGEAKKESCFLDVTLWGNSAKAFCDYHKKGSMAYVEGEINTDSWNDKETGKPRSKLYLKAFAWSFTQTKASQVNRTEQPELPSFDINEDDSSPF